MQFDYTVESGKGFDETVAEWRQRAGRKGFNVLCVHDVKATLESKGFSRRPDEDRGDMQREVRRPGAGQGHKDRPHAPLSRGGLCREGEDLYQHLRPSVLADFYPAAGIAEIAAEVERIVLSIVDEAR